MGLMESFLPDFDKDNAKMFDCHIYSFKLPLAEAVFGSNVTLDIALEYSNTCESDGRYRLTVNIWAKEPSMPLCRYIYTINIISDKEVAFRDCVDRIYELMRSDQSCHDNLSQFVEALQTMKNNETAAFRNHIDRVCEAPFVELLQSIEGAEEQS